MYYIIYKTINQIDNKYYIGAHTTMNINDGYIGSGKYLKRAIKKYGIENFKRQILFQFDNSMDMYNKEKELINEQVVKDQNSYNIKIGGEGGFDHLRGPEFSEARFKGRENANIAIEKKYGPNWRSIIGKMGNIASQKSRSGQ
jgi:hypothetical protein